MLQLAGSTGLLEKSFGLPSVSLALSRHLDRHVAVQVLGAVTGTPNQYLRAWMGAPAELVFSPRLAKGRDYDASEEARHNRFSRRRQSPRFATRLRESRWHPMPFLFLVLARHSSCLLP